MTTTWSLQGQCPDCAQQVAFTCSRAERTTPSGHRLLGSLRITCPEGHEFKGPQAERILHGDRETSAV